MLKSLNYNEKDILNSRGLNEGGKVQKFIDSECLRLCEPFVPRRPGSDGGALVQSGLDNTTIGSGEVKYRTPYARRWYYMPANFTEAPRRGNYWFERMKQSGGKEKILDGAKRLAGAK